MTPSDIILAARQFSNNEGSDFFSDAELISYLDFGLKDASIRAKVVENTDTTLISVASQQEYTLPSGFFEPTRIEYDGLKLRPSSLSELDKLTSAIQNSPTTGTPRYYAIFAGTLKLVPTPDTAGKTIKVYAHTMHPSITIATTTLSVPTEFHPYLIDYVTYRIYLKEGDEARAKSHLDLWNLNIDTMKKSMLERKKRDRFAVVQNEDQGPSNTLGLI